MAATAGNVMGAVGGFKKMKEGKAMQREGRAGIENFEWQDLSNPYRDIAISTAGTDAATENLATNSATAAEALRKGGTRGILGGIGKVQANANAVNTEIAANLDMQQKNKDFAAAGQDVANQNMMEKRQANELAGYGQMMNVGMDMKYQGIGDVQSSGQAQSQHTMELFKTISSGMTGGMGGGA